MAYLIHLKKRSTRAHIWNAEKQDTACRMYSTGGLEKENYLLTDDKFNKAICKNCLGINKHSK